GLLPRRCSETLLRNSFARPGPKSVSPAMNCSGVEVVVWWRWIVAMGAPPFLDRSLRTGQRTAGSQAPTESHSLTGSWWPEPGPASRGFFAVDPALQKVDL